MSLNITNIVDSPKIVRKRSQIEQYHEDTPENESKIGDDC